MLGQTRSHQLEDCPLADSTWQLCQVDFSLTTFPRLPISTLFPSALFSPCLLCSPYIVASGVAVFAGGDSGTTVQNTVDIYSSATKAWSTTTIGVARASLAGAAVGMLNNNKLTFCCCCCCCCSSYLSLLLCHVVWCTVSSGNIAVVGGGSGSGYMNSTDTIETCVAHKGTRTHPFSAPLPFLSHLICFVLSLWLIFLLASVCFFFNRLQQRFVLRWDPFLCWWPLCQCSFYSLCRKWSL